MNSAEDQMQNILDRISELGSIIDDGSPGKFALLPAWYVNHPQYQLNTYTQQTGARPTRLAMKVGGEGPFLLFMLWRFGVAVFRNKQGVFERRGIKLIDNENISIELYAIPEGEASQTCVFDDKVDGGVVTRIKHRPWTYQ